MKVIFLYFNGIVFMEYFGNKTCLGSLRNVIGITEKHNGGRWHAIQEGTLTLKGGIFDYPGWK